MTLSRRALVAGLIGTAGGCTPADLLNTTVPRDGYKRTEDIAYGPLPRQKLDFYQPDEPRADGKTVIFFFGGAWDHGNRGEYVFLGQALASQGTTVIIPSYGSFPKCAFPPSSRMQRLPCIGLPTVSASGSFSLWATRRARISRSCSPPTHPTSPRPTSTA